MYQKHFSTKNVWVQNKFLSRIGLISIVLKPIKFVVVFVVIVFVAVVVVAVVVGGGGVVAGGGGAVVVVEPRQDL